MMQCTTTLLLRENTRRARTIFEEVMIHMIVLKTN